MKLNILDIGSHNGKTGSPTYHYLQKEKYQVYHVEPNPYLHECLEKHNSILIKSAVSDFNGTTKFYFDKRGFNNRRSPVNYKTGMRCSLEKDNDYINSFLTDDYVDVTVKTLDTIIKENNIDCIHLLKIDTEGCDYKILKAYSFDIKPKFILTEDFIETNEKKWELLKNNGYTLVYKNSSNSKFILKK